MPPRPPTRRLATDYGQPKRCSKIDASTILIVGHKDDEHSDCLQSALRRRGKAEVVRVARDELPSAVIWWHPEGDSEFAGQPIRSGHLSGIWRRPSWPVVDEFSPEYRDFVADECIDAFDGVFESLGVHWLSSPTVLRRAELKLVQLQVASALGFRVPRTIVTNSPAQAVAFARGLGAAITKPVRYGLLNTDPEPTVVYTTPVSDRDLERLDGSPVIVQERIQAYLHMRVITVGPKTFVASLNADELDWRAELANHGRFKIAATKYSGAVGDLAQALAAELSVGYSAQDWILTQDEELVFLEANPNGQWLFLDDLWDGLITDTLAACLEGLAFAGGGLS